MTLASADVLLDDLLAQVATQPLAKRLLLGASVYRVPVDETGLAWTVGTPVERRRPRAASALVRVQQAWTEAQKRGEQLVLSPADAEQYEWDVQEERRPPVEVPEAFSAACSLLGDLTLLSPVRYAEDEPERFLVHRWTAGAVQARASEDEGREAHRAAAAYWRWRNAKLPHSREQDIEDLLEARFHHHAAGDHDEEAGVTEAVVLQLDIWGSWERAQALLVETLARIPEGSARRLISCTSWATSPNAAATTTRRSTGTERHWQSRSSSATAPGWPAPVTVRHRGLPRGEMDNALGWYHKALAIDERLGDPPGWPASTTKSARGAGADGREEARRSTGSKALETSSDSATRRDGLFLLPAGHLAPDRGGSTRRLIGTTSR